MKNAKGSNWKSWLPTTESVWVLWKCSYRVSIGAGGGLRKHVPPAITFCVQVNAMHHVFTGIYALSLHVRLINLLYQSRLERNIWLCMGARLLSSSRESIVALIGHPDLSCSCVQTPEENSSCQKCQHTQRFYKDERCIRANKILLLRMAQVTHGTFVPIILLLVQRAHRVLHKGSNVKSPKMSVRRFNFDNGFMFCKIL